MSEIYPKQKYSEKLGRKFWQHWQSGWASDKGSRWAE